MMMVNYLSSTLVRFNKIIKQPKKAEIIIEAMIKCKLLEKSIKNGTWLGIKRRIGMYVLSI